MEKIKDIKIKSFKKNLNRITSSALIYMKRMKFLATKKHFLTIFYQSLFSKKKNS